VKNKLHRRTDDVEKLQNVIADAEKQFAGCLQQIKTLSEEKEQCQKELEDLRVAVRQLVEVVDPLEDSAADGRSPAGATSQSFAESPQLRHRGLHNIC
jgi:chromosome segregation ATPase